MQPSAKRTLKPHPPMLLTFLTLTAALCLGLMACSTDNSDSATAGSPATIADDPVTIVAMGDSLTAGYGLDESEAYPAILEQRLKTDGYRVRVVNAGISGETSSGAVSRIDWVLSSLAPDIVILVTGANDGLRGIDPEILNANLDRLLTALKAAGVEVVLAGMRLPPNLGPAFTSQFNRVYPSMAKAHDVPLIPFFLEGVAGERRYNQADAIHPNAEGYRRIVDHIYPWVIAALE